MRFRREQRHEPHISVKWLDEPMPPTRWEVWTRRFTNLPAAIVLVAIIVGLVLPKPDVSWPGLPPMPDLPSPSMPDLSMPALALMEGEQERRPATPVASPVATPEPAATPSASMLVQALELDPEVDPADVEANELGRVPIIMYHAFVQNIENTDEWTQTFDQFRGQLDWFRENDFVMVGMQSMVDGRFDLPAGKKPLILTFDDSNSTQFGLQVGPDGEYEVRPNTAVAVLEEYREKYPEFHGPAAFGLLPFKCFESEQDPSTCEERLDWLLDHGYEVMNHTADHVDMTDVSANFFVKSIGSMEQWMAARMPQGDGNLSYVLVMPFGAYPQSTDQRQWLADGFWYQGKKVDLAVVLAVNGGPAISPYSVLSHPEETFRIASDPDVVEYWQQQIASGDSAIFVSDGEPDTVTVPASWVESVNMDFLERKGLELETWDDVAE